MLARSRYHGGRRRRRESSAAAAARRPRAACRGAGPAPGRSATASGRSRSRRPSDPARGDGDRRGQHQGHYGDREAVQLHDCHSLGLQAPLPWRSSRSARARSPRPASRRCGSADLVAGGGQPAQGALELLLEPRRSPSAPSCRPRCRAWRPPRQRASRPAGRRAAGGEPQRLERGVGRADLELLERLGRLVVGDRGLARDRRLRLVRLRRLQLRARRPVTALPTSPSALLTAAANSLLGPTGNALPPR